MYADLYLKMLRVKEMNIKNIAYRILKSGKQGNKMSWLGVLFTSAFCFIPYLPIIVTIVGVFSYITGLITQHTNSREAMFLDSVWFEKVTPTHTNQET